MTNTSALKGAARDTESRGADFRRSGRFRLYFEPGHDHDPKWQLIGLAYPADQPHERAAADFFGDQIDAWGTR